MKNRIKFRKLSRTTAHRQALFRNMVSSLIEHDRIKTTLPKAKELRRIADRMVTWAKKGTAPYRVKALGYVRSKEGVAKLWNELGPRYAERDGGYVRVLRTGYRTGDRAPMAIIEYVDRPGETRVPRNASYPEGQAVLAKTRLRGTPSPAKQAAAADAAEGQELEGSMEALRAVAERLAQRQKELA